jgi:ABC-type lipoprotein release transport system permease subunit
MFNTNTEEPRMKNIIKARKATSLVFAILLIFIAIIASGMMLFNFVMSKMDFMEKTFNSQMAGLLLQSLQINSTHITVWLQNAGNALIKITGAYVNGLIATLVNSNVQIEPGLTAPVFIQSIFIKGNTYTVKLLSALNTVVTFEITY